MYKTLFLVLAPIVTSFAQSKTTITCKVNNCEDGTTVFIYNPIGKFENAVYSDTQTKIENGHFTVTLNQQTPAFLTLKCKCFSVEVFAEPGESIGVDVTVKNGSNEKRFYGKNAAALTLYNSNPYPSGKVGRDLDSILAKSVSVDDAVNGITALINGYRRPYQEMYKKRAMTTDFYKAMMASVEGSPVFLYSATLMGMIADSSGKEGIKTTLDRKAQAEVLSKLYAKYDPFQPQYLNLPSAFIFTATKCNSIQLGLISGTKDTSANWQRAIPQFEKYAYAPKSHQDLLLGKQLLMGIVLGFQSVDIVREQYASFSHSFPRSVYNAVISKQLRQTGKEPNQGTSGDAYVYYDAARDSMAFVLLQNKMDSLSDVIHTLFKGKPVLVDCWATWCPPCVSEFKYSAQLDNFLEENGIGLLYLSFDNKNSKTLFPSIKGYKLSGYHYTTNDAIEKSVRKIFNSPIIGIPRYLLYDGAGHLLLDSTYRPSDGEKLYSQIRKELNIRQNHEGTIGSLGTIYNGMNSMFTNAGYQEEIKIKPVVAIGRSITINP